MGLGGSIGLGIELFGADVGLGALLASVSGGFDRMAAAGEAAKKAIGESVKDIRASFDKLTGSGSPLQRLQKFADQSKPFETALKDIRVFGGATAAELDRVEAAAKATSVTMKGFNATDAAEAMAALSRSGHSATEAVHVLNPALALARVTGKGAAEAAETLGTTLKQFRLEADQAGRVTDVLTFAMTRFGVRARDIDPGLQALSKGVNRSRPDFEQIVLLASLAGTGMRKGFAEGAKGIGLVLQQSSDDAKKSLKKFGGSDQSDIFGSLEKLLVKSPGIGVDDFRKKVKALGGDKNQVAAFTAVYEGLTREVDKSNGKFKNALEALRGLKAEQLANKGLGEKIALELTGPAARIKAAWDTVTTSIALPLARALKPVLNFAADAAISLQKFVNSIPEPVKNSIATFVVFAAKVASLFFAFVALKGIFVGLAGLIGPLLTGFGGLLVLAIQIYGPFLLLVGVFYLLKEAYDQNIGGIANTVGSAVDKIKLAWRGLMQAFSTGELSGEVLKELETTENKGVLQFVINVYSLAKRLEQIWEGFKDGFLGLVGPFTDATNRVEAAFNRLKVAIGISVDGAVDKASALPWEKFAAFGRIVGEVAGRIVVNVVDHVGRLLEILGGAITAMKGVFAQFRPTFETLWQAILQVWDSLKMLGAQLREAFGIVGDGTGFFTGLGKVIGWIAGQVIVFLAEQLTVAIRLISAAVDLVRGLIWVFQKLGEGIGIAIAWSIEKIRMLPAALEAATGFIKGLLGSIRDFFVGIFDSIKAEINKALDFIAQLAQRIPGIRRIGFVKEFIEARDASRQDAPGRAAQGRAGGEPAEASPATGTPLLTPVLPAVVAAEAANQSGGTIDPELLAEFKNLAAAVSSQPIQTVVQLNDEEIARAVGRAGREQRQGGFGAEGDF